MIDRTQAIITAAAAAGFILTRGSQITCVSSAALNAGNLHKEFSLMARQFKLSVPITNGPATREWLWCTEVTDTTARIDNVPAYTDAYAYADVVEFDESTKSITRLVERTTRTVYVCYEILETKEETIDQLQAWRETLSEHQIVLEPQSMGLLSLAVPLTVDDELLLSLMVVAPLRVWHATDEDDVVGEEEQDPKRLRPGQF